MAPLLAVATLCALAVPPELEPPAAPPRADPPLTAIVGARLIDGTGAAPRAGCTVLVRGERIAAVGPGVAAPDGAVVVDAAGKTLLPGLFDTHGHCFTADGKYQPESFPALFLAGGVTTAFSPGEADAEAAFALRARLASGELAGARLMSAGPYFEKGQGEIAWLKGYADREEALAWLARFGPRMDGLKLQMQVTEDEAKAILDDAHKRGLRVTGHLGSLTATRAMELGIDRLEHGLFAMSEFAPWSIKGLEAWSRKFETLGALDLRGEAAERLIDLIVSRRVALSATTASFEEWAPGHEPVVADWDKYLDPATRRAEKALVARRAALPEEVGKRFTAGVAKQLAFLRLVHERGGIVVTGTDTGSKSLLPGWGLHRELALLVRAGFTPLAALRAATLHAAMALGVDKDLGSIEAGKLADLVLVDGDPSADIRAVGNTVAVWKAGVRFDPAGLRKAAEGKIR